MSRPRQVSLRASGRRGRKWEASIHGDTGDRGTTGTALGESTRGTSRGLGLIEPSVGKAGTAGKRKHTAFTLIELSFDEIRTVRKRESPGFTLIELLVVISIIALLVSILVPSVGRAMEMARRANCATNLGGMGRGIQLYSNEFGGYPYVPLNGGGWGVRIGTGRNTKPTRDAPQDRNPTCCLYMLVRGVYCPAAMFICPSGGEKEKSEAGLWWDFADGRTISYAVMNPYGTARNFGDNVAGDVPLMADASPFFEPATGLRNKTLVIDLALADEQSVKAGNSPNHRQEGQNVAVTGGSACWRRRADVGSNHDNIYTRAEHSSGTDRRGSIPSPAVDGSTEDQGPAGLGDSFLLP